MLRISELSEQTDVPSKTIRYYEEIGLLPKPPRTANGYRVYSQDDVDRLQFIRRARALDFALDEIAEILAFRERNEPPCAHVMDLICHQIDAIESRIRDFERIRDELKALHEAGQDLPEDVRMRTCICHLVQTGITQS
ncbi:MAG: heavy metal-responsive transcriptional regulator [Anaerolineaceae bacterium]|nr:heavy metal-responsive transcriptional regulator [Bellilinea sp.]